MKNELIYFLALLDPLLTLFLMRKVFYTPAHPSFFFLAKHKRYLFETNFIIKNSKPASFHWITTCSLRSRGYM